MSSQFSFSNLKIQLLKVELHINAKERKCEDCKDRALKAVDGVHDARLYTEIDYVTNLSYSNGKRYTESYSIYSLWYTNTCKCT